MIRKLLLDFSTLVALTSFGSGYFLADAVFSDNGVTDVTTTIPYSPPSTQPSTTTTVDLGCPQLPPAPQDMSLNVFRERWAVQAQCVGAPFEWETIPDALQEEIGMVGSSYDITDVSVTSVHFAIGAWDVEENAHEMVLDILKAITDCDEYIFEQGSNGWKVRAEGC